MHIHLDIVGGIAGDMFVACMLDALPDLSPLLEAQLVAAGFPDVVSLSSKTFNVGILTGTHFLVSEGTDSEGHHHRHYSDIKHLLENSSLSDPVQRRALDIFRILAEAEAAVHNKAVENVAFHEVGAWDSIADVVCAAYLIEQSGATSWSSSSLPIGGGRVNTAHGQLPVPAPATALILEGFEFMDDGIKGERITPTGAAILKHLQPLQQTQTRGRLIKSGFGFGTKKFKGISNTVRAMFFEENQTPGWQRDQVISLNFEIDDQTPEELTDSLDRLRLLESVRDVMVIQALGKKGRPMFSVQLLGDATAEDTLLAACFTETTTLGIRTHLTQRAILDRQYWKNNDHQFKVAKRPDGDTIKLEMDAVSTMTGGLDDRRQQRLDAERIALSESNKDNKSS